MDSFSRNVSELRQPGTDVIPLQVIVLGLLCDVEAVDAPPGKTRHGYPVAPIAADLHKGGIWLHVRQAT